jgi:methyltransferase (TIGR00027 family)
MTEKTVQHVSDTAHWIAHLRAIETARKDALFRDPLASQLAQDRGREISESIAASTITGWMVSIRTIIIDRYISDAIADGVDTVINLGAGLDTRPYRLNLPSQLKWIEADFPQVIDFKEGHLKGETPRCDLKRVRLDLSNESVRANFLSEVNSYSRRVLVLTEGVLPYLTEEDVASLGKALASQNNFVYWIVDYHSPLFARLYRKGEIGKLLEKNIPFKFFPENWESFFKEKGWKIKEMSYTADVAKTVNRPMPVSFFRRFMLRLLPAVATKKYMRLTGYAILSR